MKTTYCKQFNVISIQHYENGRSNANVFWHSFHSKRNALWNRTIFGWKVLSLVIFFMLLNWSLICLMWWVPGLHYVHCTLHIYFEMLWNELEMPSKCFEMPLICFNLLQFAAICFKMPRKKVSKNVFQTHAFRIHGKKKWNGKKPKYTNWNWKRSQWDRSKSNIKLDIATSGQAWKNAAGLFLVSAKV